MGFGLLWLKTGDYSPPVLRGGDKTPENAFCAHILSLVTPPGVPADAGTSSNVIKEGLFARGHSSGAFSTGRSHLKNLVVP